MLHQAADAARRHGPRCATSEAPQESELEHAVDAAAYDLSAAFLRFAETEVGMEEVRDR